MTEVLIALATGLAVGLHCATWGMYKDAPHEGFTWTTYVRSPIVASLIAVGLVLGTDLDVTTAAGITVLFGVTYGLERACLEVYKSFFRVEEQSKYTIPMQFAIRGKVVESAAARWAAAVAYVAVGLGVLYGLSLAPEWGSGLPILFVVFLTGSAGGWISAIGGAWKDAPIEGFHIFKFFRSPGVAFSYGIVISMLTQEHAFIYLGAIGYTVASIETYKTFFFPNRPRGKFQGKEHLFPEYLEKRKRFVPLFVVIWIGVLAAGTLGFMGPHQGLLP